VYWEDLLTMTTTTTRQAGGEQVVAAPGSPSASMRRSTKALERRDLLRECHLDLLRMRVLRARGASRGELRKAQLAALRNLRILERYDRRLADEVHQQGGVGDRI
jgi:hypothetical protein